MANENQFRFKTKLLAVRGVKEYRQTIPYLVSKNDSVLEIGCEWGTTSKIISKYTKNLIATDVSSVCINRARSMNKGIQFDVLDVFDIKKVQSYKIPFNVVYIDVSGFSGYRSLLDVMSLVNMYSSVISPRIVVIKSGSLKDFTSNCLKYSELVGGC